MALCTSVWRPAPALRDHVAAYIKIKTRRGDVTIGADRSSIFSSGTVKLSWSYF